jgi:hypothetical protein
MLLDRGWGKAKQTVAGDPENPVSYVVRMPEPCASTEEWLRRYVPAELARQHEQAVIDGEAKPPAPEMPALEPPKPERAPSAPAPAKSSALATAEWLAEFNNGGRDYR